MEMDTLRELYVDELRDLLHAENQIIKALPKMVKAAENPELQQAFEQHLEQTKGQVDRLEQILEKMGETVRARKCRGMMGIIEENKEVLEETKDTDACDAALIAGAQKVEHYEIASYGTVRSYAKLLGDNDAARLLQQTLDEEEQTDKKLTQLAESTVNVQAMKQGA